ncbi:Plug domain-containing protein, partial [Bordetella hinzii]|nr:Plug domain-containing protein [Bordetella hinzii]
MRLSRHVALTLAFATPATFAQASDAPALAPITVSADPLGLDLNSTALPTTILDGQELVERRQGTLGDTLDGLPGVHADTFGGGASRPVIRGQTAPRVSVL